MLHRAPSKDFLTTKKNRQVISGSSLSTHPALQQAHNLVVAQDMRGLFGGLQDQRDT
jgi:hypothetical protein